MTKTVSATAPIRIDPALDERDERRLADDVLDGLTRPFKEIPPKHFYDARGSELFDRICEQPEYYPTRTELAILRQRATEIVGDAAELVELGSGAATKARVLLGAMAQRNGSMLRYVPLDVSEAALREAAEELVAELPGLQVHGLVADFERHLDRVPPALEGVPRVVALLGGTIGNFPPGTRRRLLRSIAALLRPGDRFLLGTDLVKDTAVMEAAYNDAAGVTAEFNRNMLLVLNHELGADFDPWAFDHRAFYEPVAHRIEMHLVSRGRQEVQVPGVGAIRFQAGESLRTEISCKHDRESVAQLFEAAGLEIEAWRSDPESLFALVVGAPA